MAKNKKRDDDRGGNGKLGRIRKIFRLVPDKAKATTEPVANIEDFEGLWDRVWGVYMPLVVNVSSRTGSTLRFKIVIDPSGTAGNKEYEIDLDDGGSAWGDLPSTAQFVKNSDSKRLAYLLINQNWLFENANPVEVKALIDGAGGPPKIPRTASL
jgi:hypothetical protein